MVYFVEFAICLWYNDINNSYTVKYFQRCSLYILGGITVKKLKIAVGVSVIVASFAMTAFAVSETAQNITAQLRSDYIIDIDGETQVFEDVNGNEVYPIVYEGTTYLPVRAIGEIMDKDVFWSESLKKVDLVPQGLKPSYYDDKLDADDDIKIGEDEIAIILVNSKDPHVNEMVVSNFKVADDNEVEVTLTSEIETYNVSLRDSITGVKIQTYNNIKSGTSVKFENLIIGKEYSFILSSDDAPMNAFVDSEKANATFKIH